MYLVVNQSKKLITLSDLNVSIPPGTMLDLDKYKGNKVLNARESKDLKEALKLGLLRTMKNDSAQKREEPIPAQNNSKVDLSEIVGQLRDVIKDEIQKSKEEISDKKEENPNLEMSQMISMIKDIKDLVASGNFKQSDIPYDSMDIIADDEIDQNKLMEIHSAAMKKMKSKIKSKSEISYDTSTVKDDNISNNLEDLEDFI